MKRELRRAIALQEVHHRRDERNCVPARGIGEYFVCPVYVVLEWRALAVLAVSG